MSLAVADTAFLGGALVSPRCVTRASAARVVEVWGAGGALWAAALDATVCRGARRLDGQGSFGPAMTGSSTVYGVDNLSKLVLSFASVVVTGPLAGSTIGLGPRRSSRFGLVGFSG